MKARAAAVQGALAVAGLVAAYATWQRDPATGKADVAVLELEPEQVERIRVENEKGFYELARRDESGRPAWWLHTEEKPQAVAPAAKETAPAGNQAIPAAKGREGASAAKTATAPEAVPANPAPVRPPRDVRAGEAAEKLVQTIARLRAPRALGILSEEKRKELGFGAGERRLEVWAGGARRTFTLASPSESIGTTYARDEADGKVYLLSSTVAFELTSDPQRLQERRLHGFELESASGVKLTADGKARAFALLDARGGTAKLAPRSAAATPDDFATSWHERIWRLAPAEVLGKGEVPPEGEPKVALRLDYEGKGGAPGWLELAEAGGAVFARSERTAGWVRLSTAVAPVIADGKKLAAGND